MPSPEQLEAEAKKQEKVEAAAEKPLPALASPMTRLPEAIREAVALRCRETSVSFSKQSGNMWVELLLKEKRITAEAAKIATDEIASGRSSGGGAYKQKYEDTQTELDLVKAQLAALTLKLGGKPAAPATPVAPAAPAAPTKK